MSIVDEIPTEAKLRRDIRRIVFGRKLRCPWCDSPQVRKSEDRWRCKRCRKPFSLTSVTWLRGLKLPLRQFWLLVWAYTNAYAIEDAMKLCGVSHVTVRHWYDKFREHLPQDFELKLDKEVQMDEMFGGQKKKSYAIIGAKQKGTKKIVLRVLPFKSVQRHHASGFINCFVKPNAHLFTDGGGIYQGIDKYCAVDHSSEVHSRFEFELTSEIEGLWGVLRTFIRRTYHHVTSEKIAEYVREFCVRFCHPEYFETPLDLLKNTLTPVPT